MAGQQGLRNGGPQAGYRKAKIHLIIIAALGAGYFNHQRGVDE